MSNKNFCQGPTCHEQTTSDRFLKSRGVVRGRYAYANMDRTPNSWGILQVKAIDIFVVNDVSLNG